MPRKATAIPTEQMMTYFHVASSAVRVRRCPTRKAVTTVVASIATPTTPMLLARTATTVGEERRREHPVQPGPARVGVAVHAFGLDVADAGAGGKRADHPDDDQHGDRERVGPQLPAQCGNAGRTHANPSAAPQAAPSSPMPR